MWSPQRVIRNILARLTAGFPSFYSLVFCSFFYFFLYFSCYFFFYFYVLFC